VAGDVFILLTLTFQKGRTADLKGSGLLSTGSTVDEAGFLFGLLDRSCAIQIQYVKYLCSCGLESLSRSTFRSS
jgi:ribulose-5-phosphate 4-epimerase/fuculose-1-phosphate aldolase